ncbi:flagella biosynthesis regulatory protein FliT [Buttiauxella sp.]|uniref:flagella biosynthesis regulatory protein FliT n=1 Tax=Buttiauxella sp. TaxID=1972222 RepID=UPI003C77D867
MDANIELLRCYQRLLSASQDMLKLAHEGLWEELIEREVEYVGTVEKIAVFQDASMQSQAMQAQILPLIKEILDNEVELKMLLQQRMSELQALVVQTSRQQNLNTTYGSLAGNILYPNEG